MKQFALAVIGITGIVTAQNLFEPTNVAPIYEETDAQMMSESVPLHTHVEMNSFGCIVEEYVPLDGPAKKTVKAPKIPTHMDYRQQEHFIK